MELFVLISIIALALLLVGGVVAMLIITLPIAKKVYSHTLVRTEREKWGRVCSAPENEEQLKMWNLGCGWAEENKTYMTELQIENDGLKLFGEYYDFGFDKCVVILPGRCECLKYSYFYAAPYRESGYNVLVTDSRAHGFSDGQYSTIGKEESRDLEKWARLLTEKYGIKSILLHCICIGCATGLLAATRSGSTLPFKGIILDGCFTTFRETYKRHMQVDRRPLFPVLDMIMLMIYRNTGCNVLTDSPKRMLPRLRIPVMFIHGKCDIYSLPAKAEQLYSSTGSESKRLVWMEKGCHSHLRLAQTDKYDAAVKEFATNVF